MLRFLSLLFSLSVILSTAVEAKVDTSKIQRYLDAAIAGLDANYDLTQHTYDAVKDLFDATAEWNIITGRVKFSPAWSKTFGIDSAKIEPTILQLTNFIHPDDYKENLLNLNLHLQGRSPFYVARLRIMSIDPKTQERYWKATMVHGMVIKRDRFGVPLRVLFNYADLTDDKNVRSEDEALHYFEEIYAAATKETELTEVNDAMTNILGWSKEELIGSSLLTFIHPDDRQWSLKAVQGIGPIAPPPEFGFETRFLKKDGTFRWLKWDHIVPNKIGVSGRARDVTLRRQINSDIDETTQMAMSSVLDPYFTEEAVAQHKLDKPVCDRNYVILTCHVNNFVPISSKASPKRVFKFITDYFHMAVNNIHKNGGKIHQFMDDRLLAIFSAKKDQDATKKAIAAAFEISEQSQNLRLPNQERPMCKVSVDYGKVLAASDTNTNHHIVLGTENELYSWSSTNKPSNSPFLVTISKDLYENLDQGHKQDFKGLADGFNENANIFGAISTTKTSRR